jgi:hypothetical protein
MPMPSDYREKLFTINTKEEFIPYFRDWVLEMQRALGFLV